MTQHLLPVHSIDGEAGEPMTDEQMRQSHWQVMALQAEMKSAGTWVFCGRLHEPGTATVVRMSGEMPTTDGRLRSRGNASAAFTAVWPLPAAGTGACGCGP
jgi:hypothetical protein